MAITVVGRTDTGREAEAVVRDLMSVCQCSRADISLAALHEHEAPARETGGAAIGALKGLVGGAVIGAIAGFIVGAASIPVPGFEAVIARGMPATIIVGAVIGAVLGAVIGALTGIERRTGDEHFGSADSKRAGTMITVHARDDQEADCAVNVMRRHGAREIDKRSSDWNKRDWTEQHFAAPEQPPLRVVPEPPAASAPPASVVAARSYNRPMEEAARAGAPEHVAPPPIAQEQMAPGIGAKEQAAAPADTRNWITRKYTATYFGPERRHAANQNPYQGADRRHSA